MRTIRPLAVVAALCAAGSLGLAEVLAHYAAADKLHNVRSIACDLRMHGEEVWERFQGQREGTLWYYDAVADALSRRLRSPCRSPRTGFRETSTSPSRNRATVRPLGGRTPAARRQTPPA